MIMNQTDLLPIQVAAVDKTKPTRGSGWSRRQFNLPGEVSRSLLTYDVTVEGVSIMLQWQSSKVLSREKQSRAFISHFCANGLTNIDVINWGTFLDRAKEKEIKTGKKWMNRPRVMFKETYPFRVRFPTASLFHMADRSRWKRIKGHWWLRLWSDLPRQIDRLVPVEESIWVCRIQPHVRTGFWWS